MCFTGSKSTVAIVSSGSSSISASEQGSTAMTREETSIVAMVSTLNFPMLHQIGRKIRTADRDDRQANR